jgi:N-acetylglutamate synthase-like GNAT family acetyltransferase
MTQQLVEPQSQNKATGVLRQATGADVPRIQALIAENLDKLLPRSDSELYELLADGTLWVVEETGEIVGCCGLEVYSAKIAELRTLAVRGDARGMGYGKLLVEVAVKAAEDRNIRQVLVVTSTREFFEGLGFGACLNEKYALFWNGTGRQ